MILVQDYLKDQQVLRSDSAPVSPVVSVILPTYARFASGRLQRAITSVLSQSFTDLELIVVDDGSTDGTFEFIQTRQAADSRVVHVRHELNSGLPGLRSNEGIELARGRYLTFQFDDDTWRTGALAALVEASERQPGPAVVVGQCLAKTPHKFLNFPDGPIDLPHLFQGNSIANNSVIFPRSLVERFGMFDCHLAMRRNCDWDWWIRLARRVPFVAIDTVIADVDAGLPDSIGMTIPLDFPLVRFFHSAPRDHLLRPERWRDYQIDALRAGEAEITGELARRLYEKQIIPYYERYQFKISHAGIYRATTADPHRKIVLCAKEEYDDPLFEILMRHDHEARHSRSYKLHYQTQSQIESFWMREADMLLLVRSFQGEGVELVDDALNSERPVGYFLDDDFLNLHECGSEFDCLKPGEPFHENVTEMLRRCDTVWASSRAIEESVRPINPRLVPYQGSVAEECLPADIRPRNEPLRIGCTSGRYRREELAYLWPAFVRFAQRYRERVSFEFWGVDINDLPPLDSPVVQRSFDKSYLHYLEQLQAANFDVFLAPLLGEPRARLAKAPNKYYLSAVAGALGIFSDVQPYEMLPHGDTCLKVDNTIDAWYEALCAVAEMETREFNQMRGRLLSHVRDEFTTAAHVNTHEAALRATEFHGMTRRVRHRDGRPRIVFHCRTTDFAERKELLAQYATTLRNYGVEPSLIVENVGGSNGGPTVYGIEQMGCRTLSPEAMADESFVMELTAFGQVRPAIMHSIRDSPGLARTCAKAGIPHISGLTRIESSRAANHLFADYNRTIEASLNADGEAPFAKPTVVIDEPGDPPSSHALVSENLRFRIAPQKSNWFGLEVMVGTHMQVADGQLWLRIRSAGGDVLRETSRELSHVEDNDWVAFWFRSIPNAATNEFVAEFALQRRDLKTRVSLYQTTPANRVDRILRRAGVKGMADDLYCRMFYQF